MTYIVFSGTLNPAHSWHKGYQPMPSNLISLTYMSACSGQLKSCI